MSKRTETKQGGGWSILIPVALIIAAGFLLPGWLGALVKSPGGGLALTWLAVAILMWVIVAIIGVSLNKGLFGILIDSRNMMSLSRLQIVLWTILVLSAFVTVALARVDDSRSHPSGYACPEEEDAEEGAQQEPECADPLGIQLPPLLWALMGISVTSAVASPLLKAAKAQRTADEDHRRERAERERGGSAPVATFRGRLEQVAGDLPRDEVPNNEGALVKKEKWSDARFSDIFTGEEVASFLYVDIAKVQNFFFTIITVVAYTTALAVAMTSAASIARFVAFPDLPPGLIGVISISYGGYLTDKAFTHTTPAVPPDTRKTPPPA